MVQLRERKDSVDSVKSKKELQLEQWDLQNEMKVKTREWYKDNMEWVKRKENKRNDRDIKINRRCKDRKNRYSMECVDFEYSI